MTTGLRYIDCEQDGDTSKHWVSTGPTASQSTCHGDENHWADILEKETVQIYWWFSPRLPGSKLWDRVLYVGWVVGPATGHLRSVHWRDISGQGGCVDLSNEHADWRGHWPLKGKALHQFDCKCKYSDIIPFTYMAITDVWFTSLRWTNIPFLMIIFDMTFFILPPLLKSNISKHVWKMAVFNNISPNCFFLLLIVITNYEFFYNNMLESMF